MNIQLGWSAIGVIVAILLHGAASIWWASKITTTISEFKNAFIKLDKELEKRDDQIRAIWKRVDAVNGRLTTVEAKCSIKSREE